jgi:hypothetical protein
LTRNFVFFMGSFLLQDRCRTSDMDEVHIFSTATERTSLSDALRVRKNLRGLTYFQGLKELGRDINSISMLGLRAVFVNRNPRLARLYGCST